MSIFDSPSVNFHVDDDLEYVYVPAVLALFNHVIAGIKAVQSRIDGAVSDLGTGTSTLLARFPKDSSVYPLIETLGAATDLDNLNPPADDDPKVDERLDALRRAVAALEANTIAAQITLRQRAERVLTQATGATTALTAFDVHGYNESLVKRSELQADYKAFRAELFKAADLPADPEETWEAFVSSGEAYRRHLDDLGVHDGDRCLYCRQSLANPARDLVAKYGDYLADKISADITAVSARLRSTTSSLRSVDINEVGSLLKEYDGRDDQPSFYAQLAQLERVLGVIRGAIVDEVAAPSDLHGQVSPLATGLEASRAHCRI